MVGYHKIGWTEATWNPVTDCSKKSDGCKNCYAKRVAHRLKLTGKAHYKTGLRLRNTLIRFLFRLSGRKQKLYLFVPGATFSMKKFQKNLF